jgi:hypothetical protein
MRYTGRAVDKDDNKCYHPVYRIQQNFQRVLHALTKARMPGRTVSTYFTATAGLDSSSWRELDTLPGMPDQLNPTSLRGA